MGQRSVLDDLGEEVTGIVAPVSLCMAVTVLLVRLLNPEGVSSSNTVLIASVAYQESEGDSSGKKFGGALLNALIFVGVVAAMTVVLFLLFKYQCYKIIFGYMGFAVFMIFFFITGALFIQVMQVIDLHIDAFSLAYGLFNFSVVGTVGLLFMPIPLLAKQMYLIWVGIIVAYIFTFIPEWTAWVLLVLMAIYDIVAVLMPGGPLKALVEMAVERRVELPALIYEARPAGGRPYVRGWGNRGQRQEDQQQQPPPPSGPQAVAEAGAAPLQMRPPERDRPRSGGSGQVVPLPASGSLRTAVPAAQPPTLTHIEPMSMEDATYHAAHQEQQQQARGSGRPLGEGREMTEWQTLPSQSNDGTQSRRHQAPPSRGDSDSLPLIPQGEESDVLGREPDRVMASPSGESQPHVSRFNSRQRNTSGGGNAAGLPPLPPGQTSGHYDGPGNGNMGVRAPPPVFDAETLAAASLRARDPNSRGNSGGGIGGAPAGSMLRQGSGHHPPPPGQQQAHSPAAINHEEDPEIDLPDSIKLGLGDFIFYSMLVGRAAMYDMMTVFSSYLGIIAGLGLTLLCLAIFKKALPALPFSIALGVLFYFLTRLTLEPYIVPMACIYTFY